MTRLSGKGMRPPLRRVPPPALPPGAPPTPCSSKVYPLGAARRIDDRGAALVRPFWSAESFSDPAPRADGRAPAENQRQLSRWCSSSLSPRGRRRFFPAGVGLDKYEQGALGRANAAADARTRAATARRMAQDKRDRGEDFSAADEEARAADEEARVADTTAARLRAKRDGAVAKKSGGQDFCARRWRCRAWLDGSGESAEICGTQPAVQGQVSA